MRAQIDVYAANPMALQALQPDLSRAARHPEMFKRAEQAYVVPVARLLQEGAIDGSLRPVSQPRVLAAAILGAVTIAAQQTLPSTDPMRRGELHATMLVAAPAQCPRQCCPRPALTRFRVRYFSASSWMRLPQVSSKTATIARPTSVGACVNTTP